MLALDHDLSPADLEPLLQRFWDYSGRKILALESDYPEDAGSPVFTIAGRYSAQGWTEWTEGFRYGSALLQFDAVDDPRFLEIGRRGAFQKMASHVTHIGVHDHGFNNVSTYGGLLRLMKEGRIPQDDNEQRFYELALQASGAVQAARWSPTHDGDGYIYSFNGPHSLFCDTIRSLRSLAVGHALGHVLMGENDQPISLLERLIQHARSTAQYNVYYGEGRDHYDLCGRVAHESIFNTNDGRYRCPSTQQGYSPFSTWTRGLAWIMSGYPEQLEFLQTCSDEELKPLGGRPKIEAMMLKAASAACDFYLQYSASDGVPYWDTGAPGLASMPDWSERPADPFNEHEPVDSSAAAIAAQGLLRLGRFLLDRGQQDGQRYWQAGLVVLRTLLQEPYLSFTDDHQGLLLHTVYHRPRDWDHTPAGAKIPYGESCMWGDYHLREAALYVHRVIHKQPIYRFWA